MRFCIMGAGAIGGFTGARLALGGQDVTFLARGATLEAIRARGLTLRHADGRVDEVRGVRAVGPNELREKFDVVMLALKAYQVRDVAALVEPACHEGTVVIPMQNGIPFWYFNGHGGPLAGRALESVDPGGAIRDAIAPRRILGCVVYVAAELHGPGRIGHVSNQRFVLGEPDGSDSARAREVAAAFQRAGCEAPVVADIRGEIWVKVWGNVSFNPVSALTRATLDAICRDPDGRELVVEMMREVQAVASSMGVTFRMTIDKRLEGAARVGAHKTSMLQDIEAGRPIEVDALVGAVVELGGLAGVPTPTITAIYRVAKLLDATARASARA